MTGVWIVTKPVKGYGAMVATPPDEKGFYFAIADVPEPNAEAHARLIAAAPDLLAVCEALVRTAADGGRSWEIIDLARAALAKAKGESG